MAASEILVVDDERVIRNGLSAALAGEGYAVRTAKGGEEALRMIAEKRPELVLLDVMMPKMNGFHCCEEIRRADALLPVIFLTAKDSEGDQIRAMGMGADDFLSKSASDSLLYACIRRALERARKVSEATQARGVVRLGSVQVDTNSLAVTEDGEEIARLTKTEADILACLNAHPGETVTFDGLIASLRGHGFVCEDTMIYTHVCRLREKLGTAGRRIVTTHGVGYSLLG